MFRSISGGQSQKSGENDLSVTVYRTELKNFSVFLGSSGITGARNRTDGAKFSRFVQHAPSAPIFRYCR